MPERASFRSLDESTAEDWALIRARDVLFDRDHVDRIETLLQGLAETSTGHPVSRLEHSLQTASRAHRAGESETYVVAALLHDLGELYFPANHADFAAGLLKPYVDDRLHFILKRHPLFQGYHFWHAMGGDRHARDMWRGHPHFQACAEFCARYDAPAFDASYASMPLEAFTPMLQRALSKPRPDFHEHEAPLWRRALRKLYRIGRKLSAS